MDEKTNQMKPKIIFIKTPDPRGFGENIIDGLTKSLSARNFEVKVVEPTPENISDIANQIVEEKPLFTFDLNLDGIIFAEKDGQKRILADVLGNIHVTWFTDDPMVHYMKLKPVLPSNQILFLNIDIDHGQWLAAMGKNVAFLAPGINPSIFPPPQQKDFDVAFVGPVTDPVIIEEAFKERLDENLYVFAIELGKLLFRNPEMPIRYAATYLISQFNPNFQQAMAQFQKEREDDYIALLIEVGAYAMNLRRWFILDSIDEFQINILGPVNGELKDNVAVYEDIITQKDVITFLSKSKVSLLSQPPFIPSGLGFTVFDSAGSTCMTMVEERLASKTFYVPDQEIITYHPMDTVEIEGKLAYYLEDNPEEREQIALAGKEKTFKEHTIYSRGELLANILEDIIKQAVQEDEQAKNVPPEDLN